MALWTKEKGPLAIVAWWDIYEDSTTKRHKRSHWLAEPNSFDEPWFKRLAREPDNKAGSIYCAYELIIKIASRMPVRGILQDHNGPLKTIDMEDLTGYIEGIFVVAIPILMSENIGRICYADKKMVAEYSEMQGLTNERADRKNRKGVQTVSNIVETVSPAPETATTLEETAARPPQVRPGVYKDKPTHREGKKPIIFPSEIKAAMAAAEEERKELMNTWSLEYHQERERHPEEWKYCQELKRLIKSYRRQLISAVPG